MRNTFNFEGYLLFMAQMGFVLVVALYFMIASLYFNRFNSIHQWFNV